MLAKMILDCVDMTNKSDYYINDKINKWFHAKQYIQ